MQKRIGIEVAQRRTRNARGRRRGVTMVFVTLSAVVIFGFAALAVDLGVLTIDKNKAQRAVDAAALAGAQELTDTVKARSIAKQIASQNDTTVLDDGITFLDGDTKIRVSAVNRRSLFFARLIGINIGTVGASAIAGITQLPGDTTPAPAVVPIGVTQTTVQTYTRPIVSPLPVTLTLTDFNSANYGLNNFLLFDLRPSNAKSPTQMQNQLINGTTVEIGQSETSLNADQDTVENKFAPALAARFQKASAAPWNDTWNGNLATSAGVLYESIISGNSRADSPRIVNLVVNPDMVSTNGSVEHLITATVPVYLQSWTNNQLVVRFLPTSLFSSGSGSGSATKKKVSLLQ